MLQAYLTALTAAVLSGVGRIESFLNTAYERAVRVARGETVLVETWTLTAGRVSVPARVPQRLAQPDRGQLGLSTLLAAFTVVIAAMVVLIVVDQFDQSLSSPSSSALSTAEGDILGGFGDMASLIGPLLLIAIGVVIIGLIRRVQNS